VRGGIPLAIKPPYLMNDILPYPVGTFVTVKKIGKPKTPVTEPGDWATWVPGGENNASLPVFYEMKGFLIGPVMVGRQIWLYRTHRNGVEADGIFESTLVCSISNGCWVETFNSIYLVIPVVFLKTEEKV